MKRTFDVVEWKQGNNPPKEGEYLVTVDRGWVEILYFSFSKLWWRYSYTTGDFTEAIPMGVVAWAELPEAYTEFTNKKEGESNG